MAVMMRILTLQSDPAAFIASHSPPHSAGTLEFPHNHPSSCQGHGGTTNFLMSLFVCFGPNPSGFLPRHATYHIIQNLTHSELLLVVLSSFCLAFLTMV